ncbi:MAG: Fic family protein [Pseudomonadota bacterium]
MNIPLAKVDSKTEALNGLLANASKPLIEDFNARMNVSWIYHDNALEGVVLSYPELNAAIDDAIISDVSLIPSYDDIVNHKTAIEFIREVAERRKPNVGLDLLKKIHLILTKELPVRSSKAPPKPPGQYRKDNPLHRLYFHDIIPPQKISYQMRKLVQWLGSDDARKTHPVKRAAYAHHQLIRIFPWPRNSGKVARLVMNLMLMKDGYLPAVIHAVERQNYYEALRQSGDDLAFLVAQSLISTLDAAKRFFQNGDEVSLMAVS